jgi:hypothetical protein
MTIYHIIYKTIHIDGRYYVGRHSTTNLEDGYLGSGNWVESIKDKSTLSREILDYSARTTDELKLLEGKYIDKFFNDPLNMNYSKAPEGISSEAARKLSNARVAAGTHNFQTHPTNLGGKISKKLIDEGRHHFQTNHPNKGGAITKRMLADGTHPFLNGNKSNKKRLEAGTHHFLTNNPAYVKVTCEVCGRTICKSAHTKYHGPNCKG